MRTAPPQPGQHRHALGDAADETRVGSRILRELGADGAAIARALDRARARQGRAAAGLGLAAMVAELLDDPPSEDVEALASATDGAAFYEQEVAPSWEGLPAPARGARLQAFAELADAIGSADADGLGPVVRTKLAVLAWADDASRPPARSRPPGALTQRPKSRAAAATSRLRQVPPPLGGFLLVYLVTCWFGSLALIAGPRWVREWYVYNSGAQIGPLSGSDVLKVLALLHLGPLALCAGWWLARRLATRVRLGHDHEPATLSGPRARPTDLALGGAIAVATLYLLVRLGPLDAISGLSSWVNYDDLISHRNAVVARLSFVDFVVAYSVVPLLVGTLVARRIVALGRSRRVVIEVTALGGLLVLISMMLFQKRPLLIAIVLAVAVVAFHPGVRRTVSGSRRPRLGRRWIIAALVASYVAYLALLVAPVVRGVVSNLSPDRNLLVNVSFENGAPGWLPSGPLTLDGARLSLASSGSQGQGLTAVTSGPLQGVSYDTGLAARAGSRWTLTARVRAPHPESLTLLLGASRRLAYVGTFKAGPDWRTVRLDWVVPRLAPRLFIAARLDSPGRFAIDDVRLRRTYEPPATAAKQPSLLLDASFEGGAPGWLPAGDFLLAGGRLTPTSGLRGPGLAVSASRALQGAVYRLSHGAARGASVRAGVWLRAPRPIRVTVAIGRDRHAPATQSVVVGPTWRHVVLPWTPIRRLGDFDLAVRAEQPGSFAIDDATVRYVAPHVDRSIVLADDFSEGPRNWSAQNGLLLDGARVSVGPGATGQGLLIDAGRPLEGAAAKLGAAGRPGRRMEVSALLRADRTTRVELRVGRNGQGPAAGTFVISRRWTRVNLGWAPTSLVSGPAVAVRATQAARIGVDDVTVRDVPQAASTRPTLLVDATFDRGAPGWAPAGALVLDGAALSTGRGRTGAGLLVRTARALEGASYLVRRLRENPGGYVLRGAISSSTPTSVKVLVGQGRADLASATVGVGRSWRAFALPWNPPGAVRRASIAVQSTGASQFVLDDVSLERRPSTPPPNAPLVDADFSGGFGGWSPSGPFTTEGARLRTGTGPPGRGPALLIAASAGRQGADYPIGLVRDRRHALFATAEVRSIGNPVGAELVLGEPGTAATRRAVLGSRWQRISVAWQPERRGTHPTLALRTTGRGTIAVDDVMVTSGPPPAPPPPPEPSGAVTFPRYTSLRPRSALQGFFFYALLGPVMRTAGPAIAYPWIYPRRVGYGRVDLALDVLGFGRAPDDNSTSYRTIFPNARAGVNSVPFVFSLYSQGGLLVALIGALVVGVAWSLGWSVLQTARWSPRQGEIVACGQALVVVFGVFLAGDSARNSLLASYGIAWPALILCGLAILVRTRSRRTARR